MNPKDQHRYGTSSDRIETSSVLHHRGMGLRSEIRASFSSADSSDQTVLVRLNRLRAHPPHLTVNAVAEILKRAQQEQLPCLLVGGHAVILYQVPRFTRDIDFVVPDEATDRWLDFLERLSYRVYHRTGAFIQLEPATPGTMPPVDLMLVDKSTWAKLLAKAEVLDAGEGMLLSVPHPWHLIAMKLVAAKSAARRTGASDWSDILDLLRTCKIDLADPVSKACGAIRRGGSNASNGGGNAMSGEVETNEWDIDVPEAAEGLHSSHLRQPPSWSQFMREIDAEWCQYMRVHDTPEHRLATKLATRFQLDF